VLVSSGCTPPYLNLYVTQTIKHQVHCKSDSLH
jgi:hypothetical protein